jgi:glycosyltransferase 2 family protein
VVVAVIHRIIKKRHVVFALKLLFILAAFAFIIWQSDFEKIIGYITGVPPLYLVSVLLIMILAQITSAYRMRFYFGNDGLLLNQKFSIGIYFTSMLFNTVLPGGIGGDGYKIYMIGKFSGFSRLRALKLALSERASGLFILLICTSLFYYLAKLPEVIPQQDYIIAALTILLIPCYFISIAVFLKERAHTAIKAIIYSIPIQLLNVAIVVILLKCLGVDLNDINITAGYLVLFMVAAVASILPISIGGSGLRELTVFYGAKLIGYNAELVVSLCLLFFIISVLCSLVGLFFWPRLEKLYKGE